MANLDDILNFAVPALLIIIVLGFVYTKFIQPWVAPHLVKLWEQISGTSSPDLPTKKEIIYE